MALETLEALQHCQDPLLESFLTPMTSNLTFQEVVDCILHKNWRDSEHLPSYLRACHTHTHEELDNLTKAYREEPDKSS